MPPKVSKRKSHVLIDNADKNTQQKNNNNNTTNNTSSNSKRNKKTRKDNDDDDNNNDNNYEYNDDINDDEYDENEAYDSKYQVHADDEDEDDIDDIDEEIDDEEDDESEANNRPRIETALFHENQDADEDHDDDEGTSLSPRHRTRQMEFLNKNAGVGGKREVRVGNDYQTDIPEFVSPFKNSKERIAIVSEARQGKVWKSLLHDEKSINNYVEICMCKIATARNKVLKNDDKDNIVDGRLLVLRSDYLDDLLQILYDSNDSKAAIEKVSKKAESYLSIWSVDENKLMRKMYTRYGSNLTKLGSSIPTKSKEEVKDFYFKYYQTSIHIERHHNDVVVAKILPNESSLDVLKDNDNNNDNEDEDTYGILTYTRVSGSLPKSPIAKTSNLYQRLRNSNDANARQVIKKLLIYNFLKRAREVLDNICFGQLLNVILLWQKGIILLPQLIVFVHSICQDMHKYSGTQSSAKFEMVYKEFLVLCPDTYNSYLLNSVPI
jgi:hypothetical protein